MSKAAETALIWLVIILAATGIFFSIKNSKKPAAPPKDDSQVFVSKLEHFSLLEEIALDAMKRRDTLPREEYINQLKKTALTDWAECVNLMDETKELKLDEETTALRETLHEYASQRIQETLLYIRAEEEQTKKYENRIDSLRFDISLLVEKAKELKTSAPVAVPSGPVKGL